MTRLENRKAWPQQSPDRTPYGLAIEAAPHLFTTTRRLFPLGLLVPGGPEVATRRLRDSIAPVRSIGGATLAFCVAGSLGSLRVSEDCAGQGHGAIWNSTRMDLRKGRRPRDNFRNRAAE